MFYSSQIFTRIFNMQLIMNRRLLFSFVASLFALCSIAEAAERPNVVWIVSEDNSIHYLEHFFRGGAKAPNIEAMARHGLTFDHAFSNAPVCSVARTTLATSCYGPRIGTQFHRRYSMAPMPEGLKMFPAYLREAGYYTTNHSKTDYNAIPGKDVWDESSGKASWRNRKDKSQPFFHMESHAASHEGSLHFSQASYQNDKTEHDPAKVILADYFPDTPLFRYTHARYLDRMTAIDNIVGNTIEKLREDGVLEDTFVFYFGDHGGVLPRGKGYAYASGLHVPLVVRVPENFRHLVDRKDGDRVQGFVEFVDFGPTTLNLAGIATPKQVDGEAFLGAGVKSAEVDARNETFGYADRFDEKYDFIRSVRKGKYQYMRFYQPNLPDGLQNNYRYKMLAFEEWRQLWKDGKLSGPQLQFFERKPVEALFDCESDPHQVNNLATDPKHAETLRQLRARLANYTNGLPDLSFYPESYLVERAMENPVAFGKAHQKEIVGLSEISDLALLPYKDAKPHLVKLLDSDKPLERYWACMVATAFDKKAADLKDAVMPLLKDESEIVQLRAAEFLGAIGAINPQPALTKLVNETNNPVLATEALNSVVWFKDFFGDAYPVQRDDFHPVAEGADVDDRLNYINGVPYPPKRKRKN